jgi:long-chain acyl-CoA synthetase
VSHHELLTESLEHAEQMFGRRPAVVDGDVTVTYAEFADRCRRLAGALQASGVQKGDRVAALLLNRQEYLELYYAIPGMGAVLVPLNLRHAAAELCHILEDCRPTVVLFEPELAALADGLAGTGAKMLDVTQIDHEAHTPLPLGDGLQEDDVAALFYTGGTTGEAKGVMLSHRNLVSNAHHINSVLNYSESDVYLHSAPMFHLADGGSTYALTWKGGTHAFVPKFEAAATLAAIERHRVTVQLAVPAMLAALLEHPSLHTRDTSSLRLILHGGAPVSDDLLTRSINQFGGCAFVQAFGMTEASPMLTCLTGEETLVGDRRLRSVGRPAMGVRVHVRRADGTTCEANEVGEIVGAGPNIMLGYWNKAEQTAAVLREGEYWTGDLGYFDDDHYLFVVDRAKDMIISGGENVYSAEVENALASHPAVLEVAVFGVPDEQWGERVHAALALRPGQDVTETDLADHCRLLIAGYKLPRSFEFCAELPKSGAGKIVKRDLRARHWQGRDKQVA